MILNYILSLLLRKIVVPADFHNQVECIHAMFRNDMTGLVDVLTDFAVQSANVDYTIEAENEQLDRTLNNWLQTVNASYGTFPMGIKSLAKEYMQERWKSSSFCVLQITHWSKDPDSNMILPDQMVFVDGGSIHATEKDKNSDVLTVDSWDYYIGKDEKNLLKTGTHIVNRPYTRWFDKYPIPYTIKRGIYYNYKIIESLKKKEIEVLDQIIPYMMLVLKGSEGLAVNQQKTYSQPELQAIVGQFQELYENLRVMHLDDKQVKTPIRVTNFDEEIKHLIPDLKTLFATELFEQAERNILSGLGFIDIIQGVASNRRESVLNPKAFIQEVNSAVGDFKLILNQLLYLIVEKNASHIKYNASKLYVSNSPISSFMTDEFKARLKECYDRGNLSRRTYTELTGEVSYETEKYRRAVEAEKGDDYTMFPPITQNQEQKGVEGYPENPPTNPNAKDKKVLPDRQPGTPEADNWDYSSLEYDEPMAIELVEADKDEDILELAKKNDVRETEQYLRYRQQDPSKFEKDSFRTIVLSPSKGIKAIIGRLQGKKTTTVQAYLFKKDKWQKADSKAWVEKNHPAYSSTIHEADLVTAPYNALANLPPAVKKLSAEKQKHWRGAWNGAYRYMLSKGKSPKVAETYAFRVAWSSVRVHANLIENEASQKKPSIWERMASKFKKK